MASTLRQVATGTHLPNTLAASNTTTFSRTPHILRSAVSALAIVLPNWYVAGQTETNAGPATWTASIEYPAGTFTRVTFGGAASVTASDGGNIVSDQIPVSIPKGEKFWVRLFQTAPSKAIYFTFYAGDGTAQFTSPATDMTMGGTVTTSASFQAATTTPVAIIGMSDDPAIGIYGDSISVGRGDTADAGVPLQGHLGRAFGANYAAGHVGISGDRMSLFLAGKTKRMSLAQYFTHFALNMGINDVTSGGSAATLAADTNSVVALFPGPVALCTLSPVSTSSDSWNSTASQTTVASNAVRITENTRRLAGVAGVKTIYDVNPAVETVVSPESGIWKAPGFTSDGTHPSAKGYIAEAAAIDTALLLAAAADSTAPVMTGAITVSAITSSGFTLACDAATDAIGVAGYEYSIDGGTNYTTIANAARTVTVAGRAAATTHAVRMRAFDAAGNRATPLSATATTTAAADTTAPTMTGSVTVTDITSSGAALSWQAATDAVGVAGYEYNVNGGTYVNNGTNRTISITGLPAATAAAGNVRAYDAAGNRATPIAFSFTTLASNPERPMQFTPSAARTLMATVSSSTPFGAPATGGFWNLASNPKKPVGTKDPDATIDITLDWSPIFSDITDTILAGSGVIILSSPQVGTPALIDAGSTVVGTQQTVFLSGGSTAGDYPVTFRVSSASTPPRKFDRTIIIRIEDQ